MDAERLKRLIDLSSRRKELEAQARELRKEETALSQDLVDEFTADGVDSVRVAGHTAYLHSQMWASANGDGRAAVKALAAAGLENCIQVGTVRLSALIREQGEKTSLRHSPNCAT